MRDRGAATSEEVAPGQDVQEGHERDQPEDGPRELADGGQVCAGQQVDPHEHYRQRVDNAEQEFYQLLHGTSRTGLDGLSLPVEAGRKRQRTLSYDALRS